ncbi:MAG: cytidine deaminase [Clostridia bacterium]|nr:cytidine deaminase [Clostridia bacterium]
MNEEWQRLYDAALSVAKPHDLSGSMCVGSVGAAVLSEKGNIYTGVCIDTACSLGFCAERNALSTMFTHGEYRITKVCSVYMDGTVMPPCGACRAFMLQMGEGAREIQVLVSNSGTAVSLGDLMPYCPD